MVRIVNGEIVQDNDPRLTSRQATNQPRSTPPRGPAARSGRPHPAARSAAGTPAARTAAPTFDWTQPPLKLQPKPAGGIPDVDVYGFRVPGVGLLALLAAGLFMGWRAMLLVGILGFLYLKSNAAGAPAAEGGSGSVGQQLQGAFAAAQQSLGMGSQQQGSQGATGGQHAAAPGARGGAAQQGPSSAFQGKSYKLGSS